MTPALLIRTSSGVPASSMALEKSDTLSRSARSNTASSQEAPGTASFSLATAALPLASLRAPTMILCECASALAVSKPMPVLPPVISTRLLPLSDATDATDATDGDALACAITACLIDDGPSTFILFFDL